MRGGVQELQGWRAAAADMAAGPGRGRERENAEEEEGGWGGGGASEFALPGIAPAEALHTFTLDSGASRWSSLYTLTTEPPQVAASAQVSASGPVAPPCSCRLLSHQTLLWHHRFGHPSLPRLRGMHSRLLISGLPKSLPPLLPSPASPCLPCVEGWQQPPEPPRPPAPPAPPSPPAPPAPPVPPAPPPLGPVSPQLTGNQPVLTLLLPSAFDEYLSKPESNKAQDEYVEVKHFPGGRWGQPDDCPWDESAVGANDDVADAEEASGADGAEGGTEASTGGGAQGGTADDVFPEGVTGDADNDGVEYWSRDGLPEKLPIPTYPLNNRKRPHPSSQNRDARPPSPRHKLTDHKRQGYTAAEKLKWVALMDLAVSVRALARESGIHRKCLTNWKRTAEFLKDVHSARKRMHGRGRASWYRPMELKVYEKLLEWRRKGTAVSVGRLQEWSREFMKLLYPDKKWKDPGCPENRSA
ncbi:unnamed protein product [Closterium sp. NIES-53]